MAPTKLVPSSINYMSKGMHGGPVLSLINLVEKLYG